MAQEANFLLSDDYHCPKVKEMPRLNQTRPRFVADTHNFQTPPDICRLMVSLVPGKYKRSCVMEPCPGAGRLVGALQEAGFRNVCSPPGDFWDWNPPQSPRVVVGNPPWSPMSSAYAILARCMALQPEVIVMLMPWLTLINSDGRTAALCEWGLERVLHLPRTTFRGARVQCCIVVLRRGYKGPVGLSFVGALQP